MEQLTTMKEATRAAIATDRAYVANITEQQWILYRTYGTFVLRGRAPGEPYALTEVGARKGTIDLGDKRVLDFPISPSEVAEDLAREVNADGGEASNFGVFVCAGDRPTEAELDAARHRLEEFYKRQVFIADQEWERTHNYMVITDVQRRAARWLGVEKDWAYEPKPMVDCPACGEKIRPGVAVCRACGAVLDREKAERFGLVGSAAGQEEGRAEPPAGGPPAPGQGGELATRLAPAKAKRS